MNEWVWCVGGMVLKGESWSTGRKTCPIATLSTTNPTWQYWQAIVLPQSRHNQRSCMAVARNIMADLHSGKQCSELTPQRIAVFETLIGPQFPAFYGTRRFITALTTVRLLSLSRARPFQATPQPFSWRIILILCSHLPLGLPSGLFPSPPLLSHKRATRPAHLAMFWTRTKALCITATLTC